MSLHKERQTAGPAPSSAGAGHGVVRSLPFEGNEAALVAAVLAGRVDARAALYDRHARQVHGLVFRLMGPDRDLDDVVHDVFVCALEALPTLRDPSALKGWLFGVAVRIVMHRFQRRTRQRWLRFMAPEEVPEASTWPDPETQQALSAVYEILGTMRTDERVVFVLHRVEGLAHDEAARVAGTSLATYRRRLARAQQNFLVRAKAHGALHDWLGTPEGE